VVLSPVVAQLAVVRAFVNDVELELGEEDPMAFLQHFLGFFLNLSRTSM
jgi:hypothetical protein